VKEYQSCDENSNHHKFGDFLGLVFVILGASFFCLFCDGGTVPDKCFFLFYFCHFCDTGWHCEFLQPTGSWACSLEARGLHMVFII